jgi:hypothetical protein
MRAFLSLCGALVLLALVIVSCSDDTTTGPTLPRVPSNPSPADGDSIFLTNFFLNWDCSHPEGKMLNYDVYFDTISPPRLYRTRHWADSLEIAYVMRGKNYYWKVVAVDENYISASGPIWSFVIGQYRDFPPNPPSSPDPADGDTAISINVGLRWACIDSGGEQLLLYDIYFGTDSLPPLIASNRNGRQYNPGQLSVSTTYFWKIVAKDSSEHEAEGPIWHFTTEAGNEPPGTPANPSPLDGADSVAADVVLSWGAADPEDDPLTFDVFFGTTNPPPLQDHQGATTYNPPGNLDGNRTYYWSITARDDHGNATEGPVWSFTTGQGINEPPTVPSAPLPEDGMIDVSPYYLTMYWSCEDPDNEPLTFRLYFGTSNPPPFFLNLTDDRYQMPYEEDLELGATYYWKIVAVDGGDNEAEGPIWSFVTWPANITAEGGLEMGRDCADVALYGDYAFVASTGGGLVVIDISNPTSPSQATSYRYGDTFDHIVVEGDYAYASGTRGLEILNVANPLAPQAVGLLSLVRGQVSIEGSIACVAAMQRGLVIVDIADRAHPTILGEIDTELAYEVDVVGSFAYVADEYRGLKVIDIADPSDPILIGTVDTGTLKAIVVSGNYAYAADYYSGMQMIDVSNPAHPELFKTFYVAGGAIDVYVAGDRAYFETDGYGPQVADISDPENTRLIGTVLEGDVTPLGIVGSGDYFYVAYHNWGPDMPEFRVFRLGP